MKKSIVTIIALLLAIGASAGTVTKSFDNLKKFNGIQICDTFKATLVQGAFVKPILKLLFANLTARPSMSQSLLHP